MGGGFNLSAVRSLSASRLARLSLAKYAGEFSSVFTGCAVKLLLRTTQAASLRRWFGGGGQDFWCSPICLDSRSIVNIPADCLRAVFPVTQEGTSNKHSYIPGTDTGSDNVLAGGGLKNEGGERWANNTFSV